MRNGVLERAGVERADAETVAETGVDEAVGSETGVEIGVEEIVDAVTGMEESVDIETEVEQTVDEGMADMKTSGDRFAVGETWSWENLRQSTAQFQ